MEGRLACKVGVGDRHVLGEGNAHKLLSITYNCLNDAAPEYLKDLIARNEPQRSLRSASQCRLRLPSVRTGNTNKKTMGFRSFVNSAPKLWNELPLSLRECDSGAAFKKSLKTYFFRGRE